jgi:hypothetical protein
VRLINSLPATVLYPDGRLPRRLPAITLEWDRDRPRRVILCAGGVEWPFGIQLLFDGLIGPAGVGDVFICPDLLHNGEPRHEIVLDGRQYRCSLRVRTENLESFADALDERITQSTPPRPAT